MITSIHNRAAGKGSAVTNRIYLKKTPQASGVREFIDKGFNTLKIGWQRQCRTTGAAIRGA